MKILNTVGRQLEMEDFAYAERAKDYRMIRACSIILEPFSLIDNFYIPLGNLLDSAIEDFIARKMYII